MPEPNRGSAPTGCAVPSNIWAIWENAAVPPPASALFDTQSKRTIVGERYDALLARWNTEVEATVAADGSIEFSGYYGDYRVDSSHGSGAFSLVRGQREYRVTLGH